MKLRIIFSIIVLLTACSLLPGNDSDSLTGSWDWVSSHGGFGGWTLTPESEGYHQQLTFFHNRFYTLTRNDTTVRKGKYKLVFTDSGTEGKPAIKFESQLIKSIIIETGDTLRLRENCADCYLHVYIRSK